MTLFKVEIKRWVALIVCVCFTASLFPEAHAAIPSLQMAVKTETPRILNIDIPTELASVDEWYQAPATSKPKLVVHIQDAHSNYEAQTHIRDLIKYLNSNYGFKTILVEGATSELDPNILKLFPDQERNLKLVDELAKIGEVTGAEMFLVENSAAAKGVGIEKPELYRKNFDALQKVYLEDTFTGGFFEAYEKKLGQIASRSFGPRLIQALTEWRKFETGHREFLPFVSKLADLSKKVLNLDLGVLYSQIEWPQLTRLLVLQRVEKELEKTNDQRPTPPAGRAGTNAEESGQRSAVSVKQQAEIEKEQIIDLLKAAKASEGIIRALERLNEKTANLNRIGASEVRQEGAPRALIEALVEEGSKAGLNIRDYPAFAKYAGYLILRSEIVPGALFEEIKKLFDRLLETLVKEAPSSAKENSGDEAARKRLLLLHRDEMLARKLLKLELSHDEWLAVLSRQERFYPDDLNRRMLEQLGENTRVDEADPKKVERLKKLNESFRAAFTFYSAAINRETYFFQRMQETLATTDKAILITGGFHAEGMKDLMRKYDINYGTLTPRITKEFSNDLYRKVMMTGLEEAETNDQRLPTADKAEPLRGVPQASPEVAKRGNKSHLGGGAGQSRRESPRKLKKASSLVAEHGVANSKNSKSPEQNKSAKENYLLPVLHSEGQFGPQMEGDKRSEARNTILGFEAGKLGLDLPQVNRAQKLTELAPVVSSSEARSEVRARDVIEFGRQSISDFLGWIGSRKQNRTDGATAVTAVLVGIPLVIISAMSATLPLMLIAGIPVAISLIYGVRGLYKFRNSSVASPDVDLRSKRVGASVLVAAQPSAEVRIEDLTLDQLISRIKLMKQEDLVKFADRLVQALAIKAITEDQIQDALNAIKELRVLVKNSISNESVTRFVVTTVQLHRSLEALRVSKKQLAPKAKVVLVASVELPLDSEEISELKNITIDDLIAHVNMTSHFSPAAVVALSVTFGILPIDMDAAEKATVFTQLLSVAVSKAVVNEKQFAATREMLQAFFPEMFVETQGRLIRLIVSGDDAAAEKIQILTLEAILNPNVTIDVVVEAQKNLAVPKSVKNLRFHNANAGSGFKEITKKDGLANVFGEYSALLVVPASVSVGKFPNFNMQIAIEDNHGENLKAGVAMVRGAQSLSQGGQSVSENLIDGFDKRDKKKWRITKESLSLLNEVWQKFQAALKVMQSA